MTTSGVSTFSINRDAIIRMAMLNIGKLEQSEIPTAQETADCATFLNMLVKQWQGTTDFAPGLKTWTRRTGHLFLHSTTGMYTLGPAGIGWTQSYVSTTATASVAAGVAVIPVVSGGGILAGDKFGVEVSTGDLYWGTVLTAVGNSITLTAPLPTGVLLGSVVFVYTTASTQPVKVENVMLRDSLINDTPVRLMRASNEYYQLPSRQTPTNISDPSAVYYEFQLDNSYLYTDVAGSQDVTKHLVITYLEAEQDFVNPYDTPEYPQEWYLALALGLSKLVAPMFNAPWSALMDESAKMALMIAQKKGHETSLAYFQCGDTE
jgi:hypothetical protein